MVNQTIIEDGSTVAASVGLTNNSARTPSTTRSCLVTVVIDYNTLAAATTITGTLTVGATTYTGAIAPITNTNSLTAFRLGRNVTFFVPRNVSYKVNMNDAANLTLTAIEQLL